MNNPQALSLVLAVAAVGAYLNHRWLRWPPVLGLTGVSILVAFGLMTVGYLGLMDIKQVESAIHRLDFESMLLHWLLALLLFGGALFVDTEGLKRWAAPIGMLATVGVLVSAGITSLLLWTGSHWIGQGIDFIWCALFGALIAPTDPIAVLTIVRRVKAPAAIEHKIVGESLFNDGTGVVLFLVLMGIVHSQAQTPIDIARELLVGPVGGAAIGLGLAWITLMGLRGIEHPPTEILMTLTLALGAYSVAEVLRVSAPMAAVAAGLLIGSRGRAYDMSDLTRTHLDIFWGTLDELLNAALFVMMGLELMVLDVSPWLIIAGLGTWLAVLFARMVSVGIALIPFRARLEPGTWRWLTWGGLRGGISLALALSLPSSDASKTLIALTFVVVIISSLGQGLTLERVCRRKDQRNPSDGVDHQLGPMPIQSGPERLDGM